MLNSNQHTLLRSLYSGDDIAPLLEKGLTYSQIAVLIASLTADGYLDKTLQEIVLTEKAIIALQRNENRNLTNKDEWIKEELESKIDKIKISDIYLPRKGDIGFE